MDLRNLPDDVIVYRLRNLKQNEDKMLAEILRHLREVERRRIYLKLGFVSLFMYLTKSLGYSENEAYRRAEASRMLLVAPEIELQIASGELSLTSVAVVRSAIRAEERRIGHKIAAQTQIELVRAVRGCSKAETQKVIAERLPELARMRPDVLRELADGGLELQISLSADQRSKLERAKNYLAEPNYPRLIEKLCDFHSTKITRSFLPRQEAPRQNFGRYIPAALRRQVLERDLRRCQFPKLGGGICGNEFQIEIDHIVPVRKGGATTAENLRCLCRAHNQRKG